MKTLPLNVATSTATSKQQLQQHQIVSESVFHAYKLYNDAANEMENAKFDNMERINIIHKVINMYEEAIKLFPQFLEAHLNIGILLVEIGDPSEAISHFQQLLVLTSIVKENDYYGDTIDDIESNKRLVLFMQVAAYNNLGYMIQNQAGNDHRLIDISLKYFTYAIELDKQSQSQ